MMAAMQATMPVANRSGPEPYLSIRTKFFDDAIVAAIRGSSLTPAVILAAGMDARAFRLDWPPDWSCSSWIATMCSITRSRSSVAAGAPAMRSANRPNDVSGPWTSGADVAAGFDPKKPAAFLIEGLLFYLDEATAVRRDARPSRAIACEGSWIGLDASTERC